MPDQPRTVPTDADVRAFVDAVAHPVRHRDAVRLLGIFARVTGESPRLWGPSIIGFGSYHYRYATGREGGAAAAGFSPRSSSTTVYLADGFDAHADLLAELGPHSTGRSCLYLTDLDKVDLEVLERILRRSWETVSAPGFAQV
jgi:hypothetical protein